MGTRVLGLSVRPGKGKLIVVKGPLCLYDFMSEQPYKLGVTSL